MEHCMKNLDTKERQSERRGGNGQNIDSLEEILGSLVGQVITVINPQTYTPTLTGYKIDSSAYRAKVMSCENGILRLLFEFLCDPHRKTKEKAQQFVPVDQVKRVMISPKLKLVTL
jgi:hypothetical protein